MLKIHKALADETRLRMVRLLERGALNVNEMTGILNMGQSRVSRHLKILAEAGLVTSRREGTWVYYHGSGGPDADPLITDVLGLLKRHEDVLAFYSEDLQGAQAVVASPWPLESIVPPPWLEAFLDRWDAGDRLIDAVHAANAQMLVRWPHDHAKGLAMNVLGNPLLRTDR